MKRFFSVQSGFALVELILVMGILAIIASFSYINVGKVQESAEINSALDVLLSDIKQQQIKAMVGDTEGRATSDNYGVYLEQNRYTLFHSSVLAPTPTPGDPGNFTVDLHQTVQIANVTFPHSRILFSQATGEVIGFVNGQNTFTVQSTSGDQQTVTINRYGVITQVD